ncbi:MAG TPA: DoxX family protein [Roseomonas sp.]|jgi:transmembrane protein
MSSNPNAPALMTGGLAATTRAGRAAMPCAIAVILESRGFGILARVLLTSVFWTGGLARLFDCGAGATAMEGFGLHPGGAVNAAVLALQLGASLLVILDRWTWLATGALAVFTLLTIPIAHPFWAREGEAAFRDLTVVLGHVSVIGGLAVFAILSRSAMRRRLWG